MEHCIDGHVIDHFVVAVDFGRLAMAPAGGAARSGESPVDRADEKTISEDDNHQSAKAQYERVADGHGPFRLTTVMEDAGSDREGPPRLRPWLSSELRSNSNSVGIGCSTVK